MATWVVLTEGCALGEEAMVVAAPFSFALSSWASALHPHCVQNSVPSSSCAPQLVQYMKPPPYVRA